MGEGAPALARLEFPGWGGLAKLETVSLPELCMRPGYAAPLRGSQQPAISSQCS
jgi:hypothetical protein